MKKRFILLMLITVFVTAVLGLLSACGMFGGNSGGGNSNDDKVQYLHFVSEKNKNLTVLDIRLGTKLMDMKDDEGDYIRMDLYGINISINNYNLYHVYSIVGGTYKDGTEFNDDYLTLKHYLAEHDCDTYVDGSPAYTIVAELAPTTCAVKFFNTEEAFDEEGEPFKQNGSYNVTMLEDPLPVPSRPYYHFLGWYKENGNWDKQDLQNRYPDLSDSILSSIRLPANYYDFYARWEPIAFNIVYEDDEITNPNERVIYQKDGVYELLPLESNDFWAFHGWKLNGKAVTSLDPMALWDSSAPYGDEEAYTLVLTADVEYFRHTFDYYVNGELYRSYDLDYRQWQAFTQPSVPAKEHYTGSWSQEATEFKDCRFDAVYEIDKYDVTIQTNIEDYAPGTKKYEYGTTYGDIISQLSYANKMLMGLFFDSDYLQRVNESDLISESGTLYAKFEDRYFIRSASDWALLQEHNYAYFTVENDVNFLGDAIPVVTDFYGILDGQGFTVTNFINQNNSCPITYGLFGTNNGTIKDVVFTSGIFTATTVRTNKVASVGFLTGINKGTVTNVTVGDTTVKITCYDCPTLSDTWLDSAENSLYAGVLAGNNLGTIEYSTVTEVKAETNTLMYSVKSDSDTGYMRTWASYGLIAGGNSGTVSHVSSSGSLSSTASRSEYTSGMFGNFFTYVYFPLRVGGIAGVNAKGGKIADSVSEASVTANHSDSARRQYYGIVDIGGVAGVNNGQIERCYAGQDTILTSYSNAETRMGGLSGTNASDAVIRASYSKARLAPGNRSKTEKTYCGGIAGLNSGTITYCYAVVNSLQAGAFENEEVYFGGMFGKADDNSSIVNSFVKVDTAPIFHSNVCGFFERATVFRCYAFLTDGASDYQPCDDVTVCDTEEGLLTAIRQLGFDLMGFVLSENDYPSLPGAGNTKQ